MSDRRDAVAAALIDAVGFNPADAVDMAEVQAVVSAVIAAYNAAEPTDAEVEAAAVAYAVHEVGPNVEPMESHEQAIRAALMAARKAVQP